MISGNSVWRRGRGRVILAALVAVGLFSGFNVARNVWASEPSAGAQASKAAASKAAINAAVAPLVDIETAFIAIGERIEPSVVSIRVTKNIKTAGNDMGSAFRFFQDMPGFEGQQPFRQSPRTFKMQGAGSGVIVRQDGWILTNDHVVGGADKVTVKLHDGREFDGTVRRDYRSDLALVKINASNLIPAELGDSDRVRVGQWALAFGSPFELQDTMTHGIISARARQQEIGGRGDSRAYTNLLQTDAPINPGNSGGALVNIHGQVVGINVAIESPSGGSVGIGFAIPSNTAKDVMDQLINKGKVTRGFLGVYPRPLTFDQKQKYGVSDGAMVAQVTDGTPAARAGIQPEDIITRFNGRAVVDDASLRDAVARVEPGKRVEIVVHRNGRDMTLNTTLDAAPDPLAVAEKPEVRQSQGKLGIRVETLTPDSAKQYKVSGPTTGAVVAEVMSGSPAEEAGLQPGDVIVRANGKSITTGQDLTDAVKDLKSGDTVNLVVHRDKSRSLVSIKL